MEFSIPLLIWLSASSVFFDDFERSDRAIAGDIAPSGQVYHSTGPQGGHVIQGGRLTAVARSDGVPYVILDHKPRRITTNFTLEDGPHQRQLAILSVSNTAFESGSISLRIFRTHWRVTVREAEPVIPMRVIGAGLIMPMLEPGQIYAASVEWDPADSSVTITPPNGEPVTIRNSYINTYWGEAVGLNASALSQNSNRVEFTSIEAE